jgi:hypothetical protein
MNILDLILSKPEMIIGIILLIINIPLGWIGLVWFAGRAKKSGKKVFYFIGLGIYGLSWGLMALGIFLCGKDFAYDFIARYRIPTIVGTLILLIILFAFWRVKRKK